MYTLKITFFFFFFLTGNRKIYYTYFNVIFTVYPIFTWKYRKKSWKYAFYSEITVKLLQTVKFTAKYLAILLHGIP